jgi:hypothetical protein
LKPRNTLSKVVSGRCITESAVAEKVRVHVSQQSKKSVDYTDTGVADFMHAAQASWHTSSFMMTVDVVLVFL